MSATHHPNYKRIYIALLILLVISVAGPFLGIKWVTLITAFGIAVVKANMVIQNFMHLKWERRIMKMALAASLVLVALFFTAVAPDVMKHSGHNWTNDAAQAATARGIPAPHGEAEGGPAAGEGPGVAPQGEAAAGADSAAAAPAPAPAPAAFDARAAFTTVCSTCHGASGGGDGPGAAALTPKPANFRSAAFWAGKRDAELLRAIREGGASVGKSAAMPAWGSLYNEAQAQALLDYIKTLRQP